MTARKVLLLELNEITWSLIDPQIEQGRAGDDRDDGHAGREADVAFLEVAHDARGSIQPER